MICKTDDVKSQFKLFFDTVSKAALKPSFEHEFEKLRLAKHNVSKIAAGLLSSGDGIVSKEGSIDAALEIIAGGNSSVILDTSLMNDFLRKYANDGDAFKASNLMSRMSKDCIRF